MCESATSIVSLSFVLTAELSFALLLSLSARFIRCGRIVSPSSQSQSHALFGFYSVCVRVLFYLKTFVAALAAGDKCKWKFREPQRLQINWQHTRCILLTLCSPFKRPADAAIVEVPSSLPYTRDPVPSPGAVVTVVVCLRLAACCLRLGSPRGSAPK